MIALLHAYRGEVDEAFKWLKSGVEIRDPFLREVPGNPYFRSLESDPRYKPLLRELHVVE